MCVCSSTIVKKLAERLGVIVSFASIVGIAGYYGGDTDQNQHAIVGTKDGKVREVYWLLSQEQEPGIGVLKQLGGANIIVGVAGFYGGDTDQKSMLTLLKNSQHDRPRTISLQRLKYHSR